MTISSNPFATEEISESKVFRSATRGKHDYKWKADGVIGAFEVCFEPVFNPDEPLKPVLGDGKYLHKWEDFQDIWRTMKLRKSFATAVKEIPDVKCFCGLFTDDDKTLKTKVEELNQTWVKGVNDDLEDKDVFIDVFNWNCSVSKNDKDTANIMLIRVHERKNGAT